MDCPLCNLQHVVMCICKYNLLVDSSLATLDCPFWYLCIFVKNIVDTALSHALWDTQYPSVIYAPTPWIHDTYKIKECWLHTPLFGAVYPLLCCITRCTYSQCMSRMHLHDLWTNVWITVSRRGTCFWDGQSCMRNEVWKVREGRHSVCITLKEFENVSTFSNLTQREDMVVSQDNHALYLFR